MSNFNSCSGVGDYSFTPKGRNKEIKILVLCGFAFGIGETQKDINASQCLPHCLVLIVLFQTRCGVATVCLHGGALHLWDECVSQRKETFRYTEKEAPTLINYKYIPKSQARHQMQ